MKQLFAIVLVWTQNKRICSVQLVFSCLCSGQLRNHSFTGDGLNHQKSACEITFRSHVSPPPLRSGENQANRLRFLRRLDVDAAVALCNVAAAALGALFIVLIVFLHAFVYLEQLTTLLTLKRIIWHAMSSICIARWDLTYALASYVHHLRVHQRLGMSS